MAYMQLLLCCATSLLIANALELTPQQLLNSANNEPSMSSGKAKTQYTQFPLLDDEAVDVEAVELPLDIDQDQNGNEQFALPTRTHHTMPPAWLQFADEPVQKPARLTPSINSNKAASFIKQQHKHPHGHGHSGNSGNTHGTCTIEITSKVPGICQPMSMGIGSACISGELMEVYSASHCSNY